MANKITKVEMLTRIKAEVSANVEMVEFIDHEIELLNKKAQNKKATKTQIENVGIKATILEVLGKIGSGTATDIQNADESLKALSNQKVSALLKQMGEVDKTVIKNIDKKKSIFSLVEVEG